MSLPGYPVFEIPRFARVTLLEPIGSGPPRWPLRAAKTVLAIILIFLALDFDYPAGVPMGSEYDHGENAVWLGSRWSATLIDEAGRRRMATGMAERGIEWLYADQGVLRANGTLPRTNSLYAGGLALDVHRARPDMKVLAWISGRNAAEGGDLSLASPDVRRNIVEACKYFVEHQGFDGVHLDIEPAPSGDPDYIALLDELRLSLGARTVSVAAMKWTPFAPRIDKVSLLPYSWDDGYYREVAQRVDQLVLMSYDSAIPFANLYIKYVSWQTTHVLDALRDIPTCRVLIGVPSYNDERWNFHPRAENIGSGLQGVVEGLRSMRQHGSPPTNFAGVSVFAEWTTSPEEWEVYGRVWHRDE